MKIVKDQNPIIYKQDIMNKDGKLNLFGSILFVGLCITAFNAVFKYLNSNLIDKDNIS